MKCDGVDDVDVNNAQQSLVIYSFSLVICSRLLGMCVFGSDFLVAEFGQLFGATGVCIPSMANGNHSFDTPKMEKFR